MRQWGKGIPFTHVVSEPFIVPRAPSSLFSLFSSSVGAGEGAESGGE